MNFWIDIENISGSKLGPGPVTSATFWENVERVDRAGAFAFSMPASDPRAANITARCIVRCYARVQDNVVEIGAGIVEDIQMTTNAQGESMLTFQGGNLLQELSNRSVGFLELTDGAGGGAPDALAQIGAVMEQMGWSFDAANGDTATESNVYAKFAGESVLAALVKIAEAKGEHFRLGRGRKVVWMQKSRIVPSGIRAVQGGDAVALSGNKHACIITGLRETQDAYDVTSRVYPFGSGIGDARLTMAASNRTPPAGYYISADGALVRSATEENYGRIDKYISFKDISPVSNTDADVQAAANALFDAALEYLKKHARPEKCYEIEVSKSDKLILPGETIRVIFRSVVDHYLAANIDRDLYVLEVTNRIDAQGIRTTAMQVATIDAWADTEAVTIAGLMNTMRVMESYPQLNASSYYENFYDAIDGSNALEFPVLLGREVVNVNEVRLFFKLQPLESTVKSVVGQSTTSTSGGGGGVTSASGGGGATTSEGGGSHSHSVNLAGHQHNITIVSGNYGEYVRLSGSTLVASGGGSGSTAGVMGSGHASTSSSASNHSHTVEVPAHSHTVNIPNHSHTVTPNINTNYGIFRDSSANVPGAGEITVTINGYTVTPTEGEIGSGWYEIDLTPYVSDVTTLRPKRVVNTLRITCASGKRAHAAGKVRVRTVIQAVALL